jgi:hypothetical protein
MALLGGRTHARVHFKSDTIVNYADEDWVTSKKWKCSDGRLVVSGAKTRMKGNRIVWDGVTFEKVSK